jgi:rhodanese-related sulfurtransferase
MICRIVTIVLALVLSAAAVFGGSRAKDITSTEAKQLMEKSKNVFLLDVRTVQERAQGYLQGSVLIPIDAIEKRIAEVPRNRPVIVYCAVGSRSRVVAQALANMGYAEVYNMRDGIYGWYRNGLPVQR